MKLTFAGRFLADLYGRPVRCGAHVDCFVKPLDTDLLFATGAIEGPFRRPHALTVTTVMRFKRWLYALLLNRRSPFP